MASICGFIFAGRYPGDQEINSGGPSGINNRSPGYSLWLLFDHFRPRHR